MKRLAFFLVLVALIVGWSIWSRPKIADVVAAKAPVGSASSSSSAPAAEAPLEVSHLADNLNASSGNINADLRIVADVLENFRTNFPHDGNPVGDNAEITAVLTGKNKLRYAAIPPNHPAISKAGELCDRWGTPFFFHAESGTKMGIRSAGPDKKMWTADDVMVDP